MSNPKVTIIVPVYNVEKYINKCLDSILSQTFEDYECILVDDCTTDNCGKICDEYASRDKRIKVIHKNQNEGSSQARKTGFEYSSGDYIQFIDSDDWIEQNMIEILYQNTILYNHDIIICDCYYEYNNGTHKILKQDFSSYDKILLIKKIFSRKINAYLINKMINRKLLSLAIFPFNNRSEDYYITIQNIYNAVNIGYINIPLYHYIFNPHSLSNNKERIIKGYTEEINNWLLIILFIKEKYKDLTIFNPELNNRINNFFYLSNKYKLFDLYKELKYQFPNTNYYIWKIYFILKQIIKVILPKNIIEYLKMKINK